MRKYYPLVFPAIAMLVILLALAGKRNLWMNWVRYYVALVFLSGLAGGIIMWLVIHPLVNSLRRVGLRWAYLIVVIPIVLSVGAILWFRDKILASDYGTNYFFIALSVIPFTLAIAIYLSYQKNLTIQIQAGIPELTDNPKSVLLTEGIYSRIRHPRYVETILWIIGYALFTNYLAVYLAFFLMLPLIHIVVLLEEKELKARFGLAYEEYCRHVPRYIPKIPSGIQDAA
jgi:protein-S-isoprenylcysteine O-methyltransferase Ste14